MRRLLVVVLVIATVTAALSACDESSKQADAPKRSAIFAQLEPTTVQAQLLAQTTDEGYLPKEAALQLFAVQYGPIPGVAIPTGPPGPSVSGTLAARNVLRVFDELSAEQQVAIREALDLGADDVSGGPGRARATGWRFDPAVEPYQASVDAVLPALARAFGRLDLPVQVTVATERPGSTAPQVADTTTVGGACRIRVFPARFPAPRGPSNTLIHELFHCYQLAWNGARSPDWVLEGTAEWVGATIGAEQGISDDVDAAGNLRNWYTTPRTPLFRRTYDALGFFVLAQQMGVDVRSRLRDVVVAGTSAGAYAAVGLNGPEFGGPWATTQTGQERFGPAWYLRGTGIPAVSNAEATDAFYRALATPVRNGGRTTLSAVPYATNRVVVSLQADLTQFDAATGIGGVVRLGLAQDRPLSELRDGPYCTARDPSDCVCPPGTAQAGRVFPSITGGPAIVAIGGASSPASLDVVGRSLDDECGTESACPVGTWRMDSRPEGLPFSLTSGGTGIVVTVAPDGSFVQSFDEYVTATGTRGAATFELSARGSITGRIVIPAGTPNPTGLVPQSLNASGLTGSFRFTLDGSTTVITGPQFTSLVSSLFPADVTLTPEFSCPANRTLTLSGGGVTETYQPA